MDRLFELLGVRFSIDLKAEILRTISALTHKNTNKEVWHKLESSQMIRTKPPEDAYLGQPAFGQQGQFGQPPSFGHQAPPPPVEGLRQDLEEVESGEKRYPLTTSFCHLVCNLLYTPQTMLLDFQSPSPSPPYIDFIKMQVFLKMFDREYVNPEEKWKLAEACLAIFCKVIEDAQERPSEETFRLKEELVSGGKFLDKVLTIVQDTTKLLDETDTDLQYVESSLLFAMKLLCTLLDPSNQFEGEAGPQNVCALLLRTYEVFSGIVRIVAYSQKYLHTFAQDLLRQVALQKMDEQEQYYYLQYEEEYQDVSEIALYAAKILFNISQQKPDVMLNTLETYQESATLVKSFADQLKIARPPLRYELQGRGPVHNRTRIVLMEFLVANLEDTGEPNLTHLLLGFDTSSADSVARSDLSQSTQRDCLDAIIKSLVLKSRYGTVQ